MDKKDLEILQHIASEVSRLAGIQLGEKQYSMVSSRLAKRALELNVNGLQEYYNYFLAHKAEELKQLVSKLTTHHTYFFREFSHFEYLSSSAMKSVFDAVRQRPDKTLRIWSAACSRGHEVYSLAMYLDYHLKALAPDLKFEIFGTDIDPESVEFANNGVYRFAELAKVPKVFLDAYWAKGTGDIVEFAKVKNKIRTFCKFDVANLFEIDKTIGKKTFDIIFCRNVYIYFSPEQIKQITSQMVNHIESHGLLFIGISESLNGLQLPLENRGPSIYGHKQTVANVVSIKPSETTKLPSQPRPVVPVVAERPIRVLCVDDSMSIHVLLKKMLSKEYGFEVVGTAINGVDAAEKRKNLEFDVMTLDIHMPEKNGVDYLKDNFNAQHQPVIMVTSVSREDDSLASQALTYGASDFVEKPTMANFEKVGEELRTKLKLAFQTKGAAAKNGVSEVEKSFKRTHTAGTDQVRVLVCASGDVSTVNATLNEFRGSQPGMYILLAQGDINDFFAKLKARSEHSLVRSGSTLKIAAKNDIVVADLSTSTFSLNDIIRNNKTCCLVYKNAGTSAINRIAQWSTAHFLFEETQGLSVPKSMQSYDIMPATSLAYMSHIHFDRKSA